MSTITISITGIPGESKISAHEEELEAITISDIVAGGAGASTAWLSEVALARVRDRGSPLLAEACSKGTDLGLVHIYLYHVIESGTVPFMHYELSNTIVSRYEIGTLDSSGRALQPHQGYSGAGAPYWKPYIAPSQSVNDYRNYAIARATPQPIYSIPRGAPEDKEIERIWLSTDLIRWTIVDGAISKGWDLQGGKEAA